MASDFDAWLTETQERRDNLVAYAQSGIPTDDSEQHVDVEMAIEACDQAGRLVLEAKRFLTQAEAQAVLAMKGKYPDLSSRERGIMEKDSVKDVQLVLDSCEITQRSCLSRVFQKNRRP